MDKTKIEWCDSTWNPVTGCLHECEYCYARGIAERFGTLFKGDILPEDEGLSFIPDTPETFCVLDEPIKNESGKMEPYPANFYPTFHRYRLGEYEKKKGRTIFVCSMADLFGAWVPDSWIDEVFAACKKAPQHRYLFLTKNPQRYVELATDGKLPAKDNMWYGTTTTTPDEHFFWGGACHTFVSIEPILRDYSGEVRGMCDTFAQWVIVGAETGKRKDKIIPEKSWIDAIAKTCEKGNIALFMKDSLIPIVGEDNMRREFPWDDPTAKEGGDQAAATAAQDTLAPAT